MSSIQVSTPRNRLAKILAGPGMGCSAAEAVAAAEAGLGEMKASLAQTVAAHVARVLAFAGRDAEALSGASLELGDAALHIAELAGAAGLADAGEVARGLRAMVDAQHHTGHLRGQAVELHIAALALVSGHDRPGPADTAVILSNLHRMRRAVGVPD